MEVVIVTSMIALPTSTQVGTTIAVIVIVVVMLLWVFRTLVHTFRRWAFGEAKNSIAKAWSDVESLMARHDEMSARLAVMHADAVVDQALRAKHFPGDRFATRMQFAQKKYRGLRSVWWAHNLRNELSHNPQSDVTLAKARKAVASFKSALKELGAL